MSYTISREAADPREGLTLADIDAFVTSARTAATDVGLDAEQPVRAVVSMRGRIKKLSVELR